MRIESKTTITPAPRVNSFPAMRRGVEIRPIAVAPKIEQPRRNGFTVSKIGNREVAQQKFNFGKSASLSSERAVIRSSINPSLAINKSKPAISPEGRVKRFVQKDWQVIARPRPQIARLEFGQATPKQIERRAFREKNYAYAQRVNEGQFRRPRVSLDEIQARFPRPYKEFPIQQVPQEARLPEKKFIVTRPQIVFDRTRPASPIRKPEQRRQEQFVRVERAVTNPREVKPHVRRIEVPQARVQAQKDISLRTEKQVQRLEQVLQRREARLSTRSLEVREIRRKQLQIERQKVTIVRAEIRKIQTQEQAMQCLSVQVDTKQSRQEAKAAYLRLRKEIKGRMVCLAMQKPSEGRPCVQQDKQMMLGMPKLPEPKWVRDENTNAARDRFINRMYIRLSNRGRKTVSGYELADNIPQYMKLKSKLKIMLFGDDHGLEVIKDKLRNMGKIYNKNHMSRTSKPLVEDHTAIAFRYQGTPVSENWVDTVLSGAAAQPVRMPSMA